MNFKEYLVEVGNSMKKPAGLTIQSSKQTDLYSYKVEGLDFITEINFTQRIHGTPDDRFVLEVDFYADSPAYRGMDRFNMTNLGKPLDVISHTLWCIDDYLKKLDPKLNLIVLAFTGKQEEEGDTRRTDIYLKFVKRYLQSKNITDYKVNIRQGHKVHVKFENIFAGDFR
jgi:hypothetical protein